MKLLFDRAFDGVDEMYAMAEKTLNETIAELGEAAPMAMPNTGYYLANHLAYLGKKITTLGQFKETMPVIKEWITRGPRLDNVFKAGFGTFLAAEIIEACKYAKNPQPYGEEYHGHLSDAEARELGVPLVTGDLPGFVVIIGPAPSDEEAVELIKGYQSRAIFVFLIGGIIDQAKRMKVNMGFPVRVVAVGPDIWAVAHIISFVNRAAMIFGAVQPGDREELDDYTFHRIRAFVNAFDPVGDIVIGAGAGAIAMGFPVITNDTKDMWKVPKSLIIQENTKDFIETSLEARDIKLKITKIDIPVSFSTAFEGEIIRRADMQVDMDGSRLDCFELVRTKDSSEIEDHNIEIIGPDIDSVEVGSRFPIGYVVEVAGKNMQSDFEPVFERRFHNFINCAEGVMHTGQRDLIRIRVSKVAFDAGFRAKHIGEILYAKVKSEYDSVVDKCQVKIYTNPDDLKRLRAEANEIYNKRDDRLKSLTDETVPVFYNCILCQSFSPAHVCIVSPERLGLCGAVSWLDAKATNELDPNGPCQVVTKERVVDENLGIWEDVNENVQQASHGSLQQVTLYSIMQDPMTSCGCFECICGIEPMSNGVVIVNREHTGMTPLGMTFSEMASMTGGGVQTPGFMGHGKHFIASKKFMKADGGSRRIVWMPKALKDLVGSRLNKTVQELWGVEDFTEKVGDETVAEDVEGLATFLAEKGHPVLEMEPLL
ncbi:acetyl-CoA decarbonylase/synthase complex subunit alpha/beta [Leadbettera azotonutricia]|uniref:CO-methylating acetyl-CoA synthase n=1 Tax=Leadbettera azotonutricia (strain ATCC BAA-888 / DSM 13862 / ZAS-9) TaxID=545695 RepID=F5YDA9_LEAAZ|nr:acetyl-CoA decarbonylase/synthase complex subunit alpha/beta [Leadbettera azotonutricia]AEF81423.1 carbon monoxide dehydrogenase/acetyl-coa synthase subunit alpha (acetyl-coa synthase subunit) (codh/acs) (acs subunit) [Leadbettera azotonutricia ZAS-9]